MITKKEVYLYQIIKRSNKMSIAEIKKLGRKKAIELKNNLEDQNCNLDYCIAEEEILIDQNNRTINLINQIYEFNEI